MTPTNITGKVHTWRVYLLSDLAIACLLLRLIATRQAPYAYPLSPRHASGRRSFPLPLHLLTSWTNIFLTPFPAPSATSQQCAHARLGILGDTCIIRGTQTWIRIYCRFRIRSRNCDVQRKRTSQDMSEGVASMRIETSEVVNRKRWSMRRKPGGRGLRAAGESCVTLGNAHQNLPRRD